MLVLNLVCIPMMEPYDPNHNILRRLEEASRGFGSDPVNSVEILRPRRPTTPRAALVELPIPELDRANLSPLKKSRTMLPITGASDDVVITHEISSGKSAITIVYVVTKVIGGLFADNASTSRRPSLLGSDTSERTTRAKPSKKFKAVATPVNGATEDPLLKTLPQGTISHRIRELENLVTAKHQELLVELQGIRDFVARCAMNILVDLPLDVVPPEIESRQSAINARIHRFLNRLNLACPCMS